MNMLATRKNTLDHKFEDYMEQLRPEIKDLVMKIKLSKLPGMKSEYMAQIGDLYLEASEDTGIERFREKAKNCYLASRKFVYNLF